MNGSDILTSNDVIAPVQEIKILAGAFVLLPVIQN